MERKFLLFCFFVFFTIIGTANDFSTDVSTNQIETTPTLINSQAIQLTTTESHTVQFSFYNLLRGLIGIIFLIGITYLFSLNRKKISISIDFIGLVKQIVVASSVLLSATIIGIIA